MKVSVGLYILLIQKLIETLLVVLETLMVAAGTFLLHLACFYTYAIPVVSLFGSLVYSVTTTFILLSVNFLQVVTSVRLIFIRRRNRSDNQIIFFGVLIGSFIFAFINLLCLIYVSSVYIHGSLSEAG